MRKPYFRKDRKAWYVKSANGRTQIRLHTDEKEAYRIWQEMQMTANPDSPQVIFAVIAENFLAYAKRVNKPKTFRDRRDDLVSACRAFGKVRVRDLKRHHVTKWLDGQTTWGKWARRRAGSVVKRALNWAVDEGYITANPLAGLKLPKGGRRDVIVPDDAHSSMLAVKDRGRSHGRRDGCFRAFLIALRHSGTRPGSIASVTAANVTPNVDAWVFTQHKTADQTQAPLVVWLSPCLQTLTRILMRHRPTGPLFRNSRGQPWTGNAIRCRMKNLRQKLDLPEGTVAYAYRHTFATQALLNGNNLATVAELLGQRDLKMLAQHYGHLDKHRDHLRNAAASAVKRTG